MHTLIFRTVDTIQRQHHIDCSGSRLRSMLRTTAGSLSGGGFLSGGLLYLCNAAQRLPPVSIRVRDLPRSLLTNNVFSCHVELEHMEPSDQRRKRRDVVISSLNVAIEASNLAKEFCSITPAKPVFGSFSVILTMIKVNSFLRCVGRLEADRERTGIDDQRSRLRRPWASLCRRLHRPQSGVEREAVERPQRLGE
jgi:hypothetical protein